MTPTSTTLHWRRPGTQPGDLSSLALLMPWAPNWPEGTCSYTREASVSLGLVAPSLVLFRKAVLGCPNSYQSEVLAFQAQAGGLLPWAAAAG